MVGPTVTTQRLYGQPFATWLIPDCQIMDPYLSLRKILAESWYRLHPHSAIWRRADLCRSGAFRGEQYLLLPRTHKATSGSPTKIAVSYGHQATELFSKFLGPASGIRTLRSR